MGKQSPASLDPGRQHLFDEGLEVALERELRQARILRLFEAEEQTLAYCLALDDVAVPEALLGALRI